MKPNKIIKLEVSERLIIKIEIEQEKATFKGYLKGYEIGNYEEIFCLSDNLFIKGAYNGKINYNDYKYFSLKDNIYTIKTNDQEEEYFYYEKEDEEYKYYKSRTSKQELRKDIDNNFYIIDEKNNIYSYEKGGYVKKINTIDNNEYKFNYSSGHTKTIQDKVGRKLINETTQYYQILKSYKKLDNTLIETINYNYITNGIEITYTPEKGIEEQYQIISKETEWIFLDKKKGFGYKIKFEKEKIKSIEEYQNFLCVEGKSNKKEFIYEGNEVIIKDEKNHYDVYHFNNGLEYEFNNYGYLKTYKYEQYKNDTFISEENELNGKNTIINEENLIRNGSFDNELENWKKEGEVELLTNSIGVYNAFFSKYCKIISGSIVQTIKVRKNIEYNLMFIVNNESQAIIDIEEDGKTIVYETISNDKWKLKRYQITSKAGEITLQIKGTNVNISGIILLENEAKTYTYNDGYLIKIKEKDKETNIALTDGLIGSIEDKQIGNAIITYENKLPKFVNLGNGLIQEIEYNENKLVTKVKEIYQDKYKEEKYQYNTKNQLVKHISEDNQEIKYNYEGDYLTSIKYPKYQKEFNIVKSLEKITLTNNQKTYINENNVNENNNLKYIKNTNNKYEFNYNQNQNLSNVTIDNKIINEYKYQFIDKSLNTLLSEKKYQDISYQYEYNEENLIKSIKQDNQEVFAIEYDEINRIKTIKDKKLQEEIKYKYDRKSNLKEVSYPTLKEENLYEENKLVFNKIQYNEANEKVNLSDDNTNQVINILEEEKELFDEEYIGLFNSYNPNVTSSERNTIYDIIKGQVYVPGVTENSILAKENNYIRISNENNLPYVEFFPLDNASTALKYNLSNDSIKREGTICFIFNPLISTSKSVLLMEMSLGKTGKITIEIEYESDTIATLYLKIVGGRAFNITTTILEERIANVLYNKWNYFSLAYDLIGERSKIALIINGEEIQKEIEHLQVAYAGNDIIEFGKYNYVIGGSNRTFSGKISNLIIRTNKVISKDKRDRHLYYSKLLMQIIKNNEQTINKYTYKYIQKENQTWIPLKGSLLTNHNELPLQKVNPKFIYCQDINQSALCEFSKDIIYQTNCKKEGYISLNLQTILPREYQIIFTLTDGINEIAIARNGLISIMLINKKAIAIGLKFTYDFQHLIFTYKITDDGKFNYKLTLDDKSKTGETTLPFEISQELQIIIGNRLNKEEKEDTLFSTRYIEDRSFKGFITDLIFGNEFKEDFENLSYHSQIKYLDHFKRLKEEKLLNENKEIIKKQYEYVDIKINQISNILKQEKINDLNLSYIFSNNLLTKYDEDGNITTYEYDDFNQLIKTSLEEFTYDDNGNILNVKQNNKTIKTFTYNTLNQLIKYNDLTYEYKGLYLNKIKQGEEVKKEYIYEGNRLKRINDLINNNSIEYEYDINGVRRKKVVNFDTIKYVYENEKLIKEEHYNKYNELEYYLIFEYDINGKPLILEKYSANNTLLSKYYYIVNAINNVIGLMNENKEILIRYEYNSYGEVTITKGSNISISKENPFRYKCYYYDEETKLYYLITRYYDSEIGRFTSPDSVEYLDDESINGLNLYTYCGNDPINKSDPNGHMPEWGWWVLGGVVVIACLAATIITAGGFTAGGVAIYSAMCGIAYSSEAIAISSFAFVGAASIYIGALAYNALNIGTAKIRGSSYKTAFDDFLSMGEDVFFATLFGGITGGIGGKVVYDDQRRGLGHSWTKERNDFFKKNGLKKSDYVLHHPYGRHGANIRYYYPVTPEEHKMIHHTLGYGRGQGGFNQYREYVNWWKEIISRF